MAEQRQGSLSEEVAEQKLCLGPAQVQGLYRVAKNGRTPSRRMDRIPSWINLQTMGAALAPCIMGLWCLRLLVQPFVHGDYAWP